MLTVTPQLLDFGMQTVLLASKAQVNARGLREETPLHMAMYDGHREVAELLLASQADPDARNTAGETPLHLAARKGHRDLAGLLLEHHADVNAKDIDGFTALIRASNDGYAGVARALIAAGADLNAKAHRALGDVALEAQDWKSAQANYEAALAPGTLPAAAVTAVNYRVGICLQAVGQWGPAQTWFMPG